jgi:NADH-quinone oxidoreductase subunit N
VPPGILPPAIAAGTAVLLIILGTFAQLRGWLPWLTVLGAAAAAAAYLLGPSGGEAYGGSIVMSPIGAALAATVLGVAALTALSLVDYLPRQGIGDRWEAYPLVLLSATGGALLCTGGDLITLILGLELLSISLYVLAGIRPAEAGSEESALKYFLLGAFASGFLFFGAALTYAASGTMRVVELAARVDGSNPLALVGAGLLVVGLGFKAALAPFHQWTPDVYTGAPLPITGFMAAGVKAAAFGGMFRIFAEALPGAATAWAPLLGALAVLTMIVANTAALAQRSVKRLLAYSAVAHAGYVALAVITGTPAAGQAMVYYLVSYALMNIAAFAVLSRLVGQDDAGAGIDELAGLGKTRPLEAAVLTLIMLALTGIPPLSGFVAKYLVFLAAAERELYFLIVVGVLTSVIAAAYYLRVVVAMWLRPAPVEAPAPAPAGLAGTLPYLIGAAGVLLVGLLPALLLPEVATLIGGR